MVDDEDYEWLSKYYWNITNNTTTTNYARSSCFGKPSVRMHRLIMGLGDWKTDKIFVDHIDGNGLNNQKSNLRLCDKSQNGANRRKIKHSTSYTGVRRIKPYNKYYHTAQIKVKGKSIHLGCFLGTSEGAVEAAKAYDSAAKKYFGEFANLNFP